MAGAAYLLAHILSFKTTPTLRPLAGWEVRVERAWTVMTKLAVIVTVAFFLDVLTALLIHNIGEVTKVVVTGLATLTMLMWTGTILIASAQAVVLIFNRRENMRFEVSAFSVQQDLAESILAYAEKDVDQVELWLKRRANEIGGRARGLLGGEVTLGALLATFQSDTFRQYVADSVSWFAPFFRMSPSTMTGLIIAGVAVVMVEALYFLGVAAPYRRLNIAIEHSRMLRPTAGIA